MEQITIAMDNSNGNESSFLQLTSSIIACMTFLCGGGGVRINLKFVDQQCSCKDIWLPECFVLKHWWYAAP